MIRVVNGGVNFELQRTLRYPWGRPPVRPVRSPRPQLRFQPTCPQPRDPHILCRSVFSPPVLSRATLTSSAEPNHCLQNIADGFRINENQIFSEQKDSLEDPDHQKR